MSKRTGRTSARAVSSIDETRAYHELRSPAALIVSLARCGLEENDPQRVRSMLEAIERVAERTLRVVTAVLDERAGRAAGRPRVPLLGSREESAPRPAEAVRSLAADLDLAGRTLAVDISTEAEHAQPAQAPGSFEALLQVLITNALDHGDPAAPVRIALWAQPRWLLMTVANRTGAAEREDGHGVGLALARSLVRRMNGVIQVSSGGGFFEVFVRLPQRA